MNEGIGNLDWAWLAGFLDARGMIAKSRGAPRLRIRHGDFDVLSEVADMLDVPLRGPFFDRDGADPHWVIQIYAHDKLLDLYEKIAPYLSDARASAFKQMLDETAPTRVSVRTVFTTENCGRYPVPIPSQGGYRTHMNRGEEPCRVCAESCRLYERQYRERVSA